MKPILYMQAALVALLTLGISACGQKGPLVAPPASAPPAVPVDGAGTPGVPDIEVPQEEIEIEDAEEQY